MIQYEPKAAFTLIFWSWRGSVVPRIFCELIVAIGLGFLAYYADNVGVELVSLVDFLGSDASDVSLPSVERGEVLDAWVHALLILPIAFLLGFRSVIAYVRYWWVPRHPRASLQCGAPRAGHERRSRSPLAPRAARALPERRDGRTQVAEMVLAVGEMMRLIATYAEGASHARAPRSGTAPSHRSRRPGPIRSRARRAAPSALRSRARRAGDDEEAQIERAELRRLLNMLFAVARQHLALPHRSRQLGGAEMTMVTPNEGKVLAKLRNRLPIVAQWISFRLNECARAGRISRNDARLVESRLADFLRAWSGAKRVAKTPLPYAYVQVLNLLLYLFVYSAPFTFSRRFGGLTPALSAFVALTLFGINAAAAQIENPFGADANDLQLGAYAAVVEEDSEMILRQRDPDTEKYEKFWGKRALHQRLLREGPAPAEAAAADGGASRMSRPSVGIRTGAPKIGVSGTPQPVAGR